MIYQVILLFENDILYVKEKLEKLLNIKFEMHDSGYWGIYYLNRTQIDKFEDIEIKDNFVDDDWQFDEDTDCPLVVYLNGVKDNEDTLNIIIDDLQESIKKVLITEMTDIDIKKYLYVNKEKILINTKIRKDKK